MAFLGFEANPRALPPRFGGNSPSNVGWETDHLAAMNGADFQMRNHGTRFF